MLNLGIEYSRRKEVVTLCYQKKHGVMIPLEEDKGLRVTLREDFEIEFTPFKIEDEEGIEWHFYDVLCDTSQHNAKQTEFIQYVLKNQFHLISNSLAKDMNNYLKKLEN
jgi:hypothetical protein